MTIAMYFHSAYRPFFTCLACRGGAHGLCPGAGIVRDGFQLPDCDCPDASHQAAGADG